MPGYVQTALFVYHEQRADLLEAMTGNGVGATVTPVELSQFIADPGHHLRDRAHVVVAADLPDIKAILQLSREHGFSVGILPSKVQKALCAGYEIPADQEEQIKLSLRDDPQPIDLVLLNDQIMLFHATMGRLPLLETHRQRGRVILAIHSFWRMLRLKMMACSFVVAEGRKIDTASCGVMIVQPYDRSLASRLISSENPYTEGLLNVIITAPMSIVAYLSFLAEFINNRFSRQGVPSTLGFIRDRQLDVSFSPPIDVIIDGEAATMTPLHGEVLPGGIRMNVGKAKPGKAAGRVALTGHIDVKNLPAGKELSKARDKHISFLGYASEARFRELFMALREDARISGTYVTLMILSTLLATVGLFLSSASVIIGAMLLAPLMAPIISLAMGIVRQDDQLTVRSIKKTIVGILIALVAAAGFSLFIADKTVTLEMQARLNPTLLDLAVAIFAGIAGAYTKSYKEILQSLAGVAIAVALVPPLAVAGIGLGRADLLFFSQAFLLFSTNLIGIILSAALTFRILGYSPVVRNKRGMAVVGLLMVMISVPLIISYQNIIETRAMEQGWQQERFLVGGKYLIVEKATLRTRLNHDVLYVDILAREPLNRNDLAQFKEKIQRYFSRKLIVRANVTYIL